MKAYQITYKPYTKKVSVKEYYEGATPEWEELIQDKYQNDPIYNVLNDWKSLQKSGISLVQALDNRQRAKNAPYNIIFNGRGEDFQDLLRIGDRIKESSSLLKNIEHQTVFTDSRVIIQTINSNLGYITSLYEEEFKEIADSLKHKIEEECNKAAEAELTVMVVGMQNSGKSTLINSLIGKNLLPVSGDVETATMFTIRESEKNYVRIIMENQVAEDAYDEILLVNGKFQYNELTKELMDVLHTVNESSELQNSTDDTARISYLLKKINDKCKIIQQQRNGAGVDSIHAQNIPLPKEIIIGLAGWINQKKEKRYCIMDLPGAGVSEEHIGAEHQKLIREKMNSVDNAVVVYVLKADSANDDSALKFLKTIKGDSASDSSNGHSRVDFDQAIYVLNKADAHTVDAREIADRYSDYRDGKWVLTAAYPALQFRTKTLEDESLDESYIAKFVLSPRNRPLIDFTVKSALPAQYTPEYIEEIIRNEMDDVQPVFSSDEDMELMHNGYRRTGVPLVSALISEYAEKYAVVHKVGCYYNAAANSIEELGYYENQYKDSCIKYQNDLEEKKRVIIKKLQEDISSSRDEIIAFITPAKVTAELQKEIASGYEFIRNNLESWIKQAFSVESQTKEKRKQQEKLRKERDKEVKKQIKAGYMETSTEFIKIDEIVEWETYLTNTINKYVEDNIVRRKIQAAYIKIAEDCFSGVKAAYQKILNNNTDGDDLTASDVEELSKIIADYRPDTHQKSYEVKPWSAGKTLLMLLQGSEDNRAKYIKKNILTSGDADFTHFWITEIAKPFAIELHKQIIEEIKKMTFQVLGNVNAISPSVKTIQAQLNECEEKLKRLKRNLEISESYKEYCKKLYETGVKENECEKD